MPGRRDILTEKHTELHKDERVTVVGGSAAGFWAALLLAQEGFAVQVIEQAESLEAEARTLIATHRLREFLGPIAGPCVVNEIRRFELFTDGRTATIELRRPDLILERSVLIRGIAEQAKQSGVRILLGRRFRRLKTLGQEISLEVERVDGAQEELRARTVIGSDGALSQLAQAAGWPPQKTLPLVQAIVPLPKDMRPDTVRIWFVPQETPYFYWLIPDSAKRGALGLIGETGSETRTHLERFLEKQRLDPLGYQGARIPLYTGWMKVERKLGEGRVFLVGDAAAHVKVTTVGGIVTGFRGALGVVEAIVHGQSQELRRLKRELDLHLLLRKALHSFTQADYSRLMDLINVPARQSLSQYSRDDALKVIWRLCLSQPRLILMGLRGLLTGRRLFVRPSH